MYIAVAIYIVKFRTGAHLPRPNFLHAVSLKNWLNNRLAIHFGPSGKSWIRPSVGFSILRFSLPDKVMSHNQCHGLFTLHRTGNWTGTATGNKGFIYNDMFTIHMDRDRDREQEQEPMGCIPISPLGPVPGPVLGNRFCYTLSRSLSLCNVNST